MSTLDSAIRILQCLSPERPLLRVSEVSQALDLPKSTVSRLLKTLSDGGLLARNEDSRAYSSGPLMLQWGSLYLSRHSLLDLVEHVVTTHVETFGFTGYAGILDGADAIVLRSWQGSYPLRFVLEVGSRNAAFQAAVGIALLSEQDDAHIAAILGPEPRDPVSGITKSLDAVMAMIARFRRDGWIELPCETVPGITAIGTLVKAERSAEPSIGISMSFPDHAADAALRTEMAASLVRAAHELSTLASQPLRPIRPSSDRAAAAPARC